MSLTSRERNLITGLAIAAIVVGGLAFLAGRSLREERAPGAAETVASAAAQPRTTVTMTVTQTVLTEPEPGTGTSTEGEAAVIPPEIVDWSATPVTVRPGQLITYTVKVRGAAASVSLVVARVEGANELEQGPGFALIRQGTAAGITTWECAETAGDAGGISHPCQRHLYQA